MVPELKQTTDGSYTLYVKELDESYHSMNGALTESMHVFIANGFNQNQNIPRTVFEVGFGTGLNCLLTAIEAEKNKLPVNYIGIEKYPLSVNFAGLLKYSELLDGGSEEIFNAIWSAPWGQKTQISPLFNLLKLEADLITDDLPQLEDFDVVYFDAFSPNVQPLMWQPRIFNLIFNRCNHGAVFTTYSAKGQVRRDLAAAGFTMQRIQGPPGKKEMLRGIKEG